MILDVDLRELDDEELELEAIDTYAEFIMCAFGEGSREEASLLWAEYEYLAEELRFREIEEPAKPGYAH